MALQPQTKTIPLFGGIDTKMDAKYVAPEKQLTAQNVQYFGVNRARKRYGQSVLTRKIGSGGSYLSAGNALASFNNELLLYDGTALYSYAQAQAEWVSRGTVTEAVVSRTPIIRSSGSVSGLSSLVSAGVEIYAWEDTRGGVYYAMRDSQSGAFIVPNTLLYAGASCPQIVACGAFLYIFFVWNNFIQVATFSAATPGNGLLTIRLLAANLRSGAPYAIAATATRVMLAYPTDASNWITGVYDSTLALLASNTFAATTTITTTSQLAYNTTATKALLSVTEPTTGVRLYSIDATTVAATFLGNATSAAGAHRSAGVAKDATNFVFYFDLGYSSSLPSVTSQNVNITTGAITAVSTTYGLSLAAQPVLSGTQVYTVCAGATTNLTGATSQQTAFYLVDASTTILLRFSGASAYTGGTSMPAVQVTSSSSLFLGLGERTALRADANGTIYSQVGITSATFTFPTVSNFKLVPFGTTALVACGNTYTYDGANLVESGFWEFPDGITATVNGAGTGNLTAGAYVWIVVYDWIDAAGNVHYSAPSYPVIVGSLAAPIAALNSVTLTIPYTALTRKTGVNVSIYRTATSPGVAGGTNTGLGPWYKVTSVANIATGTASFTYTDTLADASVTGQQFLYAPPDSTGELENDPPPPFLYTVATKTRVFGIPQDDLTAVWYSKPLAIDRPAEFSGLQILRLETDGGTPTALGAIDTQAIVFKQKRIYYIPGDGPNAGGGGTFFPSPQRISSSTGCISQPSVLSMHEGVYYKSSTGLELLTRSLTVNPAFGLPVQGFLALSLTGAVVVGEQNLIRWTTSSDTALVYDYVVSRWCTYTNYDAVAYTAWNGTYARLRSDGVVWYEDTSTYLDNGVAVQMLVETSWLKLADMAQGYGAIWYAAVLGEYRDPHTLTTEIAYDYIDAPAQVSVWTTAGNINTSTFGSSATYGSDTVYGANVIPSTANYECRVALARQTCSAVKFKIYDSSITGASCDLNEIALQLGVIGGLNRVPSKQQV